MMDKTLTAEMLLQEIFQSEASLRWFEQKYGLLSETFYDLFQQGKLRDEDPDEIEEYLEWAAQWELYQDRRQRYNDIVAQRLQNLPEPSSLRDLQKQNANIPVPV